MRDSDDWRPDVRRLYRMVCALCVLILALSLLVGHAHGASPDPVEVEIEATGTIEIEWQPPTENVDGTPLEDLAGYNVYWGHASRAYTDQRAVTDQGATSAAVQITLTEQGQTLVYAAMTAIDDDGHESGYSNEVVKAVTLNVDVPPGAPQNATMEFTVDGCVVLNVPGAECQVTVEDVEEPGN